VRAGKLRQRVTVEALVVEIDSDGQQVETWVDAFGALLSAEIMPVSGRELIAADAVQSKITTRIKMRHRPGLLPSMRVVHRERLYNIEAIVPDPESGIGWVTLQCSDGVNEG
jgi:SPP1 family predicted phage head-tail adaptor